MIAFPPCKINLGLHVTSKRADGFHNIETCFVSVPWTDILEIIPSTQTSLTVTGIDVPGSMESNIVFKAYALLKKDFELPPVEMHLHKVIPHGAGLGGGSSDGAHALVLINRLFDLKISTEKLKQYALQLGSDCPFFVEAKPVIASGRGEIMTPIDLKMNGLQLVLVKPSVSVSTADAYAGITPKIPAQKLDHVLQSPVEQWRDWLKNDFEETVFRKYPVIENVKKQFYQMGAVYASMSGSGSAVFGLFDKEVDLQNQFPNAITWKGTLIV